MIRDSFVLVCCEHSQAVTLELRKKGIIAFSCDILPGAVPDVSSHIFSDCSRLVYGDCYFYTCDGVLHYVKSWDFILAFPPCRYLADSGWKYFSGSPNQLRKRISLRSQAADFFSIFFNLSTPYIIENSFSSFLNCRFRDPDVMIQPYFFGDPYNKLICLWTNVSCFPDLPSPDYNAAFPNWVRIPHYDEFGNLLEIGSEELRSRRALTFPGVASFLASCVYDYLIKKII